MAYRILSAAIVACLAGLVGAAQAANDPIVNEQMDRMYPACRNTPIAQMTRAQLEKCEMLEKLLGGPIEAFKRLKEEEARGVRR